MGCYGAKLMLPGILRYESGIDLNGDDRDVRSRGRRQDQTRHHGARLVPKEMGTRTKSSREEEEHRGGAVGFEGKPERENSKEFKGGEKLLPDQIRGSDGRSRE